MTDPNSTIFFVFIHAKPNQFVPAFLTKLFSGSTAFHCGFLDESDMTFFDMNKIPRKCVWPRYRTPKWVTAYPAKNITRTGLEHLLRTRSQIGYGYLDYLAFGWRRLLESIGIDTKGGDGKVEAIIPNFKGEICSEMLVDWANLLGYNIPTLNVMSPGELEDYLKCVLGLENTKLKVELW